MKIPLLSFIWIIIVVPEVFEAEKLIPYLFVTLKYICDDLGTHLGPRPYAIVGKLMKIQNYFMSHAYCCSRSFLGLKIDSCDFVALTCFRDDLDTHLVPRPYYAIVGKCKNSKIASESWLLLFSIIFRPKNQFLGILSLPNVSVMM